MKKFLITTALSIATTAAFGAASVRTPQLGGATVTSAATTNTARAGTMRAQTMKTSSISSPASVTTTQSIATPVSTETTDARLSLLKGIKGFNPGKIKDTTATTSELNSLNDRIEELTAQLDRAEAAQSSVITEANIDAKIDQKLSALGASTSTKETYSKAEVDRLLAEKLPAIDANGNLNISDSSGATIAQLLPYNLYSTYKYNDLASTQTYKLIVPHDFKTSSFGGLAQDYTRDWVSDICATERSNPDLVACGFYNADGKNTAMTEFSTISCFKGMQKISSSITDDGIQSQYTTFENLTESQIRYRFCGELSSNECSISGYTETPMGACTEKTFITNNPMVTAPRPGGTVVIKCPTGCTISCIDDGVTVICSCYDSEGHQCKEEYIDISAPAQL